MIGSRIVNTIQVLSLVLPALASGCGGAYTEHYFAAADVRDSTANPKLTFYRVRFKADSFGVKSTLQQGFYDAEALHQLFGEVQKPAAGTEAQAIKDADGNNVTSGTYTLKYDPATDSWRVLEERERFTIIYGANADAMAEQVQAFADNDELGKKVGQILKAHVQSKQKKKASTLADPDAAALKDAQGKAAAAAGQLVKAAGGLVSTVGASQTSAADTRRTLVRAAQVLLTSLGSKLTLDESKPDDALKAAAEEHKKLSAAQP